MLLQCKIESTILPTKNVLDEEYLAAGSAQFKKVFMSNTCSYMTKAY